MICVDIFYVSTKQQNTFGNTSLTSQLIMGPERTLDLELSISLVHRGLHRVVDILHRGLGRPHLQCSTVQYRVAQYNTVTIQLQYSTVQYNTVHYSYSTAVQYG